MVKPIMLANAFIGNPHPPTESELAAELGAANAVWDRLLDELATQLKLTVREWNSYSRKAGWSLRLKLKDRNIVYLSPHQGCFTASFALGDKAVKAARAGGLPPAVIEIIDMAKRYAEGTAVRMEVRGAHDVAAIVKLAAIKVAN